jgi:hypothetical protein
MIISRLRCDKTHLNKSWTAKGLVMWKEVNCDSICIHIQEDREVWELGRKSMVGMGCGKIVGTQAGLL